MESNPERLTDQELIARCRQGQEAAWEEFVRRFGRLVYSVPTRMGLSPEACNDVFQDVFETVIRSLASLRDPQSLPKWLMTVAYHAACRVARRPSSEPEVSRAPAPPPEEDLVRWERCDLVRRALERLGGNCERLLNALFRRPEAGGYQDIAARLGMPVGSIGPTRNRCLRKLLEILEEMDPEQQW